MKKCLFLVSCFAAVLMLNSVSIAQATAQEFGPCAEECACHVECAVPVITLPYNHPGLSINPRDVRRAIRLDARITQRQMRLEHRFAPPPAPAFPFLPQAGLEGMIPGDDCPCDEPVGFASTKGVGGFVPGTTVQTGRLNASIQKHNAGAPVINFLSIIRPAPKFYAAPAYPCPQ